jgi:hypothetical protein
VKGCRLLKRTKQQIENTKSINIAVAQEKLWSSYRGMPDEALAWDYHCNVSSNCKNAILAEANKRSLNLCAIIQIRYGGSFVQGLAYNRESCGGKCKNFGNLP